MKSTRPVDGNIAGIIVQLHGTLEGGSGVHGAEVKQTLKHWTVISDVVVKKIFGITFKQITCKL